MSGPLPAYTQRSVTRPRELDALLDRVRRDGYAINHGSYREGVGGSRPDQGLHRQPRRIGGALPARAALRADRFDALREATVDAAIAISAALGGPAAPVLAGPDVKAR